MFVCLFIPLQFSVIYLLIPSWIFHLPHVAHVMPAAVDGHKVGPNLAQVRIPVGQNPAHFGGTVKGSSRIKTQDHQNGPEQKIQKWKLKIKKLKIGLRGRARRGQWPPR